MKFVIIFASKNGVTKKIAARLSNLINGSYLHVKDIISEPQLFPLPEVGKICIFLSPTYGDEELELSMEEFLIRFKNDFAGLNVVCCETGNYYGYDKLDFGAKLIMAKFLLASGANIIYEGFSLDSFPRIDLEHLETWAVKFKYAVGN